MSQHLQFPNAGPPACQKQSYPLRGNSFACAPHAYRTRARTAGTANLAGFGGRTAYEDLACCAQCTRYRSATLLSRQSQMGCADRTCSASRESVAIALIQHSEQLVLIKRSKAPLEGYWAPPAGHVESGETVPQAMIREAREESGLDISLDGMVGVYTEQVLPDADSQMVITAFNGHSVGGEPVAGDDAVDIALFKRGKLPIQAPPRTGTPTDYWVFGVIQRLTANWR